MHKLSMAKILIYALAASLSFASEGAHCSVADEGSCKPSENTFYVCICASGIWQSIRRGQWECVNGKMCLPAIGNEAVLSVSTKNRAHNALATSSAESIFDLPVAPFTTAPHNQANQLTGGPENFSGDLTYYATGLGACGEVNKNGDNITAVSHVLYDAEMTQNPNDNPICGRILRVQRYDEELEQMHVVDLRVVDRCEGCAQYDLDVTEITFGLFAPIESGRVKVEWAWKN